MNIYTPDSGSLVESWGDLFLKTWWSRYVHANHEVVLLDYFETLMDCSFQAVIMTPDTYLNEIGPSPTQGRRPLFLKWSCLGKETLTLKQGTESKSDQYAVLSAKWMYLWSF